MTEKEMEKLFKSKLNNREFAFNPANWEKMEAILDQKATAGGWYYWRSAAAVLLFGIVVAGAIYLKPAAATQYDGISGPDFIPEGKVLPNVKSGMESNSSTLNTKSFSYEEAEEFNQASPDEGASAPVITGQSPAKANSGQIAPNEGMANAATTQSNNSVGVNPSGESSLPNTSVDADVVGNFEPIGFLELSIKDYVLPEMAALNLAIKEGDLSGYGGSAPAPVKINTSGVFINVGPVFTGSNANNTLGTGFLAGVGYRKTLNYGFGVETGLNYFVLNNVNIQNHSDSVFYRFGKERVETEEVNSRLDYLEIPLNLTYKLAPRHQLGVGGYAAILLNVNRDITRTTYTPKSGTSVEDDRASGYLDEFNRFDFGLSAFYRYSVSSRLNVGLHFKQGLLDITHDVSEGYAVDHTNFNTRIVLEYSLF